METSVSTEVIQGDEQSRDGHYRAKQDVRQQTAINDREKRAAELDANDTTSLQAQNPFTLDKVRVGSASEEAAGIPAIWNTMLYGIGEMGPIRSSEAFLKMNHRAPTRSGKSSSFARTALRPSQMSQPKSASRRSFSPAIPSRIWPRNRTTGLTSKDG
jgi:hypothetical protein